ncbi:MAG: PilZ domain-containing protein [Terriglobia bacterium]
MQENASAIPRRWQRQPTEIPIGLVLRANHFKADDTAIAVEISLHGARVRTKLSLVPGEWVGVVPKGKFPYAIPSRVVWVRQDESIQWTYAGLALLGTLEA